MSRVVVIGAGIAGLWAAARLRAHGVDVTLVTKGIGGLQLSQGTIDVLGYAPDRVERPLEAIGAFTAAHPEHPYALVADDVAPALAELAETAGPELLVGSPEQNVVMATAVGGLRPTALLQPSMRADLGGRVLVAGFARVKDFWPELVAGNLSRQGVEATAAMVDVEFRPGEADTSGLNAARALDHPELRATVAATLRPHARDVDVVLLPAVLGLKDRGAAADLAERLGCPVAEVPLPPPGVPGMRLNEQLTQLVKHRRARWVMGSHVRELLQVDGRATGVRVATAGSPTHVGADAVLLATGGFESGALHMDSRGNVTETALGLPVRVPDGELIVPEAGAEQPLFGAGVAVDAAMRVLDAAGDVIAPNVFAAGGVLAGAQRWREKSGEGIALASAHRATTSIMEELA